MAEISELSPMMQSYMQTKNDYKDCILFYRLGDFYEMFYDDAITASRELELTLTSKANGTDEKAKATVPNLKGVTYEQAKNMLKSKNLNISYSGNGIVIAQDPTASSEIEEGSIVTVTLQAKTSDYEN